MLHRKKNHAGREELESPQDEPHHRHLPFRLRVTRITWQWFPSTMSTGALASLLGQQPFTFPGLTTIGKIFFILDMVLFLAFSSLIAVRFVLKRHAILASLHHPSESFFFGAWWVSLALLLNCAASYGIPGLGGADGGGAWLVAALRVLFWVYFACAILVAVLQYYIIFQTEHLRVSDAMPAWILPAYPFLVSGPLAAQIAKTQPDATAALQIIVAGISGQGLGWILALLMYSVYFTRLIRSDMPNPSVRPGMYVSVGPAAYTAAGLLALGQQAHLQLPAGFLGITSLAVGDVWLAAALPAGLFLWMVAIWFSGVTTLHVARDARRMRFSLQWWAFVFPNAGLAMATIQIGKALGSHGVDVFAAALTVLLVCFWFLCAAMHVRAVWRHDLLQPGRDQGVDDVNAVHDRAKEEGEEDEKMSV
ncbi:hypothetical protein PG997_004600 [Apiospora hydei]|uniref:C4-dicarboxylate transporter/malic acid transport protein n=1 Tax=Apiospora hydei TaxID=1337664 RepID=A0ABR1X2M9_9PEZI